MQDDFQQTALWLGASSGNVEVVQRLVKAGGNSQHVNHQGATTLMQAVDGNNPEVVSVLLDLKVDATATDNEGRTALDRVTGDTHSRIKRLLKKAVTKQ